MLAATSGTRPYTRELARLPRADPAPAKYWPPVRRIDGAYGDRNLVCSCPPVRRTRTSAPRQKSSYRFPAQTL